jgi:hypothetical protein
MRIAKRDPSLWLLGLAAASLLACQLLTSGRATPPPAGTPATASPRPKFAVNTAGFSFAVPAKPGGTVQLNESNLPFLTLFPDLRDAPAPDWLQTGARVTYRVQSATIPQVQDQQGAAGAGYAQYDVVAVDQGLVVANAKLYLDTTDGAAVLPSLVFPVLGLPGVGEFWLNQQALANAEQVATDELAVARMDKTIEQVTYHGVYFEYKHEDTRYAWMYDDQTGLLLFSSYAIGGENDATRQLGQVTFMAQRQLGLPWHDGRVPAWVARTRQLHYSGTFETAVSGAAVPGIDASADVTLQDHFAHWCAYSLSGGVQGAQRSTVARLTGGDQLFDGLWLAPEALEMLTDGQTLDTDPITGAAITVARDPRTVTLTETGQRYQTALTYDRNDGRLLENVRQEQIGLATTITRLQLDSAN